MNLTEKSWISSTWAQIVFWFPSNRWIIVDQTKRTSILYHNSLTWLDWARWASLCNLVLTWTFLESNNTFSNNCLFIVISEIFFTLLASMGIRSEIDLNAALQVPSAHWSDKNLWVWNCPSRNFLFIDSYRIDVSNLNLYDAKKKLSLSCVIKSNGLIRYKNSKKSLIMRAEFYYTRELIYILWIGF